MASQPTPDDGEFSYFSIQAVWGVTKHMGGAQATDKLAALCHIDQDKTVLEVGCGVGLSTCHLAKKYGCRVTGVDLSEKMVAWTRQRAQRKGLKQLITAQTADANQLPFEDNFFDVVLSESVTAFPTDKQHVVNEYTRVAKAGGFVGLNEVTWLKAPVPAELDDFMRRTTGGVFLYEAGWRTLLENAGLKEIQVQTQAVDAFSQRREELRGMDAQDFKDRLRALGSFMKLLVTSAGFRRYARTLIPSRQTMRDLFSYMGYGLYVGRKAAQG
jgi:ubiquinone/menaquinone biosynthesis C-methylase UbiE